MLAECSAVLHLCKLTGLLSCAFWISESSVAILDKKDGDSEGKLEQRLWAPCGSDFLTNHSSLL